MTRDADNLASRWARAGAMFNAKPSSESPDLEELLVDTAKAARGDARLFTMAASWLAENSQLVNQRRLATLIRQCLAGKECAVMGFLLDTAAHCSQARFDEAISACEPAPRLEPVFDIYIRNPAIRRLAEKQASPLARKWNLLAPEIRLKPNAILTRARILANNPSYQKRISA